MEKLALISGSISIAPWPIDDPTCRGRLSRDDHQSEGESKGAIGQPEVFLDNKAEKKKGRGWRAVWG